MENGISDHTFILLKSLLSYCIPRKTPSIFKVFQLENQMVKFVKYFLKKTGLFSTLKNLKVFLTRKFQNRYDFIYGDITNICNLRCPHCYNDWEDPFLSKSIFMSEDHFKKIIPLIPLAANQNFHISCAFEPSLHPKFTNFISMIPRSLQKGIFFTTNLTTNISDETFQLLSQSNFRYINLSIESFKPDVYELCRKNAKHTRFIDNLERLAFYFSKNSKSPPLRYITLVSKLNLDEIPSIIKTCSTKFHAWENEIRYFYSSKSNLEWINKYALSKTEWDQLEITLSPIPYKYFVSNPFKEEDVSYLNKNYYPKKLWIQSNGIARIEYRDKNLSVRLDDIDDPYTYFKNELKKLK
jgi:MoaA/NifB/PqqE/SkfB family radical SAM enzyme